MHDRVAIVTGANRGIGLEIAKNLSKDHSIIAISKSGNFDRLKQEIGEHNSFIQTDISSVEESKRLFQNVKRLDVLVNNAGILKDAYVGMISDDMINSTFAINVTALIRFSQYAAKIMMKKGSGNIVNISSVMGAHGNVGQTVYSASKAAVLGITKSMSKELAKFGIRVNAICPGIVETDMSNQIPKDKLENLISLISMKRTAKPNEIANVVRFLATDVSSYVTGQVIEADGGMLL